MNVRTIIIAIVTLVIGFGLGFVLRPVFLPVGTAPAASQGAGLAAPAGDARGTQYFAANLDEAREIVAQCAAGTVRGQECANAEIAIVEAEGKERFDAFMGR